MQVDCGTDAAATNRSDAGIDQKLAHFFRRESAADLCDRVRLQRRHASCHQRGGGTGSVKYRGVGLPLVTAEPGIVAIPKSEYLFAPCLDVDSASVSAEWKPRVLETGFTGADDNGPGVASTSVFAEVR